MKFDQDTINAARRLMADGDEDLLSEGFNLTVEDVNIVCAAVLAAGSALVGDSTKGGGSGQASIVGHPQQSDRLWLAGMAMQGLIPIGHDVGLEPGEVAHDAVAQADALLAELAKGGDDD